MLPKAYDPKATEDHIYKMWEESGAFKADNQSKKPPFTISMPPPNATGQLHLGHAVMLALEDIFIRFARMQGKEALWVPGTDHAAIATENVVIGKLRKEKRMKNPREELGREKLLTEIRRFVDESQNIIRSQIRKMGASCDWSRERYTMDPQLNRCVNEVFKLMYEDGLIYRGHRIVNWDPHLQTNVSDDEVTYVERPDPLYWFQYGPFQISTVRPETKFGDKYVVMHPDDKRYAKYKHGETFEAEWINGKVNATVIKDAVVDPEFGSGVMTITPWHDHTDFELAERHKLDKQQIIGFDGRLLEQAGEFFGQRIEEARPLIIEKLRQKGLLVRIDEKYVHTVATNSRGGGLIEPQIREQWFIDVNKKAIPWKGKKMSLKDIMHDVVTSELITIIPDRFNKIYFHWIDNLRDWCISRQIWWGHRIPVWYKGNEKYVGVQPPPQPGWEQDSDTLDTWFSAGLWTWSSLVEPALAQDFSLSLKEILEKSPDMRKFHPTDVMETGYDILFFWVARMILMTTYVFSRLDIGKSERERIPFKTVYLHGLIRTRNGRKMSKSHPETMIDPLDMISKYGADALRLSMIVGQSPGNDSKLYEEKIAGYRNFINKLWNASRFVLMQCETAGFDPKSDFVIDAKKLSLADRALLTALQDVIDEVTQGLATYRLSDVGDRLYGFVWDYFCDWYLELSKGDSHPEVLVFALRTILTILHPYCPFVTEELWKAVSPKDSMLIKQSWPRENNSWRDQSAFDQLQIVIDVITALRKLRTEQGIEPGKKLKAIVHTKKHAGLLSEQREHIVRLVRLEELTIDEKPVKHQHAASAFLRDVEVHLPLEGVIDLEAEKKKLLKEQKELQVFTANLEKKLSDKSFAKNAPPEVVEKEKEKLINATEKLRKIDERLTIL